MKKLILTLAITVIAAGAGFAVSTTAGTSSAQFLKLGAGARASGMGDAFVGVVDDASAIYWNPAGMSNIDRGSLSVMHAMWLDDISYEWAAYAQPVSGVGVFGLGVQYLSYGSLTKLDSTGLEGDTFSPADMAGSLSYATKIGKLGLGVNLKYISMKIVDTATSYAGDIGMQYNLMNDRLWLGLALQNMGSKIKFLSIADPLPMNIKLGGAYQINGSWIAALDINSPNDDDLTFGAGTEYVWMLDSNIQLAGRVGYNTISKDTGGLNGMTAGLGFTYDGYTIDYAYVPYGDLGNTQRVSLVVKF